MLRKIHRTEVISLLIGALCGLAFWGLLTALVPDGLGRVVTSVVLVVAAGVIVLARRRASVQRLGVLVLFLIGIWTGFLNSDPISLSLLVAVAIAMTQRLGVDVQPAAPSDQGPPQ